MEHSKTPWIGKKDGRYNTRHSYDISNDDETLIDYAPITDASGNVIAFAVDTDWAGNLDENARRIVACVNACEGIETEALEDAHILIKAAANNMAAAILAEKQRDQLAEALKELIEQNDNGIAGVSIPCWNQARAALAAVKGE